MKWNAFLAAYETHYRLAAEGASTAKQAFYWLSTLTGGLRCVGLESRPVAALTDPKMREILTWLESGECLRDICAATIKNVLTRAIACPD
jgi:hypothetical protein